MSVPATRIDGREATSCLKSATNGAVFGAGGLFFDAPRRALQSGRTRMPKAGGVNNMREPKDDTLARAVSAQETRKSTSSPPQEGPVRRSN